MNHFSLQLNQRRVALALQGILFVSVLIMLGVSVFSTTSAPLWSLLLGLCTTSSLFLLTWFRVRYALELSAWVGAIITPLAMPMEGLTAGSMALLLPAILAMIFAGAPTILLCGVVTLLMSIVITGAQGSFFQPIGYITYCLGIGALVLARVLLNSERRRTELQAAHAEEARASLEQQARLLSRQAEELVEQNEQQRDLLKLVETLEAPVVRLADGVLFVPLQGQLTEQRVAALADRVLGEAHRRRARHVILDITGVPAIDGQVATGLIGIAQSLRLLGCQVILSGTNATVALALTSLGVSLADIRTVADAQAALNSVILAQ